MTVTRWPLRWLFNVHLDVTHATTERPQIGTFPYPSNDCGRLLVHVEPLREFQCTKPWTPPTLIIGPVWNRRMRICYSPPTAPPKGRSWQKTKEETFGAITVWRSVPFSMSRFHIYFRNGNTHRVYFFSVWENSQKLECPLETENCVVLGGKIIEIRRLFRRFDYNILNIVMPQKNLGLAQPSGPNHNTQTNICYVLRTTTQSTLFSLLRPHVFNSQLFLDCFYTCTSIHVCLHILWVVYVCAPFSQAYTIHHTIALTLMKSNQSFSLLNFQLSRLTVTRFFHYVYTSMIMILIAFIILRNNAKRVVGASFPKLAAAVVSDLSQAILSQAHFLTDWFHNYCQKIQIYSPLGYELLLVYRGAVRGY